MRLPGYATLDASAQLQFPCSPPPPSTRFLPVSVTRAPVRAWPDAIGRGEGVAPAESDSARVR